MIGRSKGDVRGLIGQRCDWLSQAFRVRFPENFIELLGDRVKEAKKHGQAPISFGGDAWQLRAPKVAMCFWLEAEGRGERVELLPTAPGQFVSSDGEVIPGFTLALHLSGVALAGYLPKWLARGWKLARRVGEVFEVRVRRGDLTLAADPVAGTGGGQHGQQRQQDQQPAQAYQFTQAQPQPQQPGGQPGGKEGPSPSGQSGEQ